MSTIYRMVMGIAALGLALGFVIFWPSHNDHLTAAQITISEAPAPAAISIWEMHNLAHLEFLPIEQYKDQSLVFHQAQR